MICYSCLNLAISIQICLSVRCPRPFYYPACEKLTSTCDNLGAVYSSCVDSKQLYEDIPDWEMLVSSRATWSYRVLKSSWHSSNCFPKKADDGSMYCKLWAIFQQSETGPFIPPEPQWLRISQGRLCDPALMSSVAIGNPERHMHKASHCGSKQQ